MFFSLPVHFAPACISYFNAMRLPRLLLLFCLVFLSSGLARAGEYPTPSLMGPIGLNVIPSARMDAPGTMRLGLSTMDPYLHAYIGLQIAPALHINIRQSAEVSNINEEAARLYPNHPSLKLCESSHAALKGADALVIVTEWQEFRSPDFDLIKEELKTPVIFDGRNLYDTVKLEALGLDYYGIGRGKSLRTPA